MLECIVKLSLSIQFCLQRVRKSELGEVVVLDVDTNRIETPFDDLERLPPDIVMARSD